MQLRQGITALVLLGATQGAWAGSFDARGMWRFDPNAVFTEGFESSASLIEKNIAVYTRRGDQLSSDPVDIDGWLTYADGAALEGSGYWQSARGRMNPGYIALTVPPIDGRIEVRMWTRAQPGTASLTLTYGDTSPNGYQFAVLGANATGRRTSDEWIELSTGPVDSVVMGRTLKYVSITSGFADLVVDAIEIVKVGPRAIPDDTACFPANASAVCGTYGDCLFGTCVDAALVWGQVPLTETHRREYTERLAHIFQRMHGNRLAVRERGEAFATRLAQAARSDSPRVFFGEIAAAVHHFRDQHTSAPMNYSAYFYPSLPSTMGPESSGAIGACFGLTDLDLRGGGRGYTVFKADPQRSSLTTPLQVGDILTSIDGLAPDVWMRQLGGFGSNAPSDPASDPPWNVLELPGAITTRATRFTVQRCESATTCAAPETITVDVASRMRELIRTNGHLYDFITPFLCDGRFKNAVTELAPPDDQGYDVVSYERRDGIATFQFDGFTGNQAWGDAFTGGLADRPTLALFDARLGNGGTVDSAQFLVDVLRDESSPLTGLASNRLWDNIDPEGFYDDLLVCIDDEPEFLYDACSGTISFKTNQPAAPGTTTKIAWLNTADVSANDIVPRMLSGRPNLRIFAPTPSSGAFGAIMSLPPLLASEASGGSIQIHDTRFSSSLEGLKTVGFESGRGVQPDEIVVQKLSDSLNGVDTMQERALAWLRGAP